MAAVLLLPCLLSGQARPRVFQAPPQVLDALDLDSAVVQELLLPPAHPDELSVVLSFGGRMRTLRLRNHDLRAEGYRVLVDDGDALVGVAPAPAAIYRGEVVGEPDSLVAATLTGGRLRAELRSRGRRWSVQPADDALDGIAPGSHVVYERDERREMPFYECAMAMATESGTEPPSSAGGSAMAADSSNAVAELAVDVDFPFYQTRGSDITAVQDDIVGVLNAVDAIYNADVGIEHRITAMVIRTAPVYAGGDGLLSEFRQRWNAQHDDIPRDIAHLFSGGPNPGSVIGRAYLSQVCSSDWGYGVSWTNYTGSLSGRVDLAAHELGHNWGASHCNGTAGCGIMCSVIQGCGVEGAFGMFPIQEIEAHKSSRTCLQVEPLPDAPPVITSISPETAASYDPETVTLTGENLDLAAILVDGVPAVVEPVSSGTVRFVPPVPVEIGSVEVRAENTTGSSTIDLTIEGIHPSVFEAPGFVFRGVQNTFRIHTDREWQGLLLASASNVPSEIPGIVELGVGNNFLNIISIPVFADTRGLIEVEVTIPVEVQPVLITYWQAITFPDPVSITFPVEVSNLATVVIF